MINELIDQANNIPSFGNQATELTSVLDKKVHIKEDEELIYIGFKLALNMVEQHPRLIQPTLYETMKTVKSEYKQLTKFTYNYRQMSAVSLAVNHLRNIRIHIKVQEQTNAFIEHQLMQQKEDEQRAEELANEIGKMLQPFKPVKQLIRELKRIPKAIWVLKVKGEDCQTAEPFIAGYKTKEVAERIGISAPSVLTAIKEQKAVKGYKIWLEA